jgi:transposase, IS5 family
VTRRETFRGKTDQFVPRAQLCAVVERFFPTGSEGPGRPTVGLERMQRIRFLRHWFNLSDPAVEEAPYDSAPNRAFVWIDLGREAAPDETT